MIFRLQDGVRELLSLTPIFRELRSRFPETNIYVETDRVDLFKNNPDITDVAKWIDVDETHIDLNMIDPNDDEHVMDIYANHILMDTRIANRHLLFFDQENEPGVAESMCVRPPLLPKLAVISNVNFLNPEDEFQSDIVKFLETQGYCVIPVIEYGITNGTMCELIRRADLYIGTDSEDSYLAMTTDTPMIMFFTYRNPIYSKPFRRGIPFVPIVPDPAVCPESALCMQKYVQREFRQVYGVKCPRDQICDSGFTLDQFKKAFGEIAKWNA